MRDLLLKRQPKDFDITTDALPEQVQELFRRAYLIGRRFRITHVRVGSHVIEVTTFRSDAGQLQQSVGQHGQLLEDNLYGKRLDEDARRRDFTVNALYYDPDRCEVLDFTGGLQDLEKRQLRVISDPETRYREDPVRMLRALRLAAKLNFQIEERSAAPIAALAPILRQTKPGRMQDEVQKLLCTGFSVQSWNLLLQYRLVGVLFPCLDALRAADGNECQAARLAQRTLENTDQRFNRGQPVTMAFLSAALLWSEVQAEQQRREKEGTLPFSAMREAGSQTISGQSNGISLSRRFSTQAQHIWDIQLRLLKYRNKTVRACRLLADPNFRAGYDLLRLREQTGEESDGLGEWWQNFRDAHPDIVPQRPPFEGRRTRIRRERSQHRDRPVSEKRGRAHRRRRTSV